MVDSSPAVVVTVMGEVFAWSNGFFSGSDESLARKIRRNAKLKLEEVRVHALGQPVTPGSETPREAAAAMMSLDPGRARILKGAEYVYNDEEKSFGETPEENIEPDGDEN